ncbi:alkaline phosphatase family protein [Nocardioides coralli]|uniref:alkaline phosphatase family protein n=1 Tax=Nocardioides coralli TaxID=2872154 RepID=UPI001CA3DA95|nr:alkaline phosphatase family protein [Nocardioides coralli]QZY28368.1 alkaline phosphatase family protein [Nocardioides coralli]
MPLLPWTSLVAVVALAVGALAGAPVLTAPPEAEARPAGPAAKVLVISVDSLSSRALRRLGREGAPHLHRLLDRGAGTLNARTVREMTLTLPNHTSMVTGRRVDRRHGGHGVYWNDDRTRPRTVHEAAGRRVPSVFSVVDSRRRDPGLFVSKSKLALFKRSWPEDVDRLAIVENNGELVRRVRADLVEHRRALTFLHLSLPDVVGHRHGFLSRRHLDAISTTDRRIGRLLTTIRGDRRLRERLTVIVTADHGGIGGGHGDPTLLHNYRIPFLVWGAGVAKGADLYELNPDYRDPGRRRTGYAARRQPIRNGDVANLVTDLLGLPALRGSHLNADQRLDVS